MLSSTSGEDLSGGVGLSDSRLSSGRRQMLDLINALHSTGVQVDIDLPMIAVIGQQSAGKSSLIESISGITLPRASGTCTRCPTECRLAHSKDAWKCSVSLRVITDADGRPLGQPRNVLFGDPMLDKDEVEERIRRAQRAILNPSTDHRQFLNGDDEDPFEPELTFSTNCVTLQISGPDVTDLSFVDLPGLIASVGTGGNKGDIDLVKSLVSMYIGKPSCIILLTVACETDFENQGAHHLAKTYDPDGKRTIGVLTKPDRIPAGEEERWLRFIRNDYEPLENGWFTVKQPDSRALAAGISWTQARQQEREYFSSSSQWTSLGLEYQSHLGTANLTERLSVVLSECIATRLPQIQDELQAMLQETDDGLNRLPKPPSADPFAEVLHLLATFSRALAHHLEGTPSPNGLLQSIRPELEKFRIAIRASAPDFRPYERPSKGDDPQDFVCPQFLSNEEITPVPPNADDAVYLDDVMNRAKEARTRELPNHYPFIVTQELIYIFVREWQGPSEALFHAVHRTLQRYVKKLVTTHFEQYPYLRDRVTTIVADFITSASKETLSRIHWLLDLERRPRTMNNHYFSDYRDKFLSHYKACRAQTTGQDSLSQQLEGYRAPAADSASASASLDPITKVLSGLAEMGMSGITPLNIAKLLPPDPYEPAIDIMADVRAYFQVAYKRFADNVPMALDFQLILGLDREQALDRAVRKGLGIGSADAHKRCAEYVQEPRNVAERREELVKKRERLETAKRQLMEL